MKQVLNVVFSLPAVAALSLLTLAAGETPPAALAHGQVDWAARVLTATGSGAPDLKAANVAVARLGAERAAKMDALRNIIEAVRGIRVSGTTSAANELDKDNTLRARVEGSVRNFKVVDTKYFSDGGVDLVVQVPLDGVLLDTLVSDVGKNAAVVADPAAGEPTGVVVNAKSLGAAPALAPRLLSNDGKEIYGPSLVAHDAAQARGIAAYVKSLDDAMRDPRVAGSPLLVRAARLAAAGSSDLVIVPEDAAKLEKLKSVLAAGRVIIVVD